MSQLNDHADKPVALVLGATGLIGGILLRKLLDENSFSRVYAITRKKLPLAHSHLENIVNDFSDLERLVASLKVDVVFCCLGTTMKKAGSEDRFRHVDLELPLKAAKGAVGSGAHHYVVVSATGSNKSSLFFYNRVKGELEEGLSKLNFPFLTILRPSLLLGERDESRLLEKCSGTLFSYAKPLLAGKLANIAPIEARVVAERMSKEAENVISGNRKQSFVVLESGEIPC